MPLLLLLLCLISSAAPAQQAPSSSRVPQYGVFTHLDTSLPHSVLFIGNSYTYVNGGVDVHLRNLVHASDSTFQFATSSVAVGGYTLSNHWNYPPTRAAIASGQWDVVVLQEQSQRPAFEPDSFYIYARRLHTEILRAHSETAFYMTWGRQTGEPGFESLATAYETIGRGLGTMVVPVGRAWQRAISEDSKLNLYETDGSHPNPSGTYLTCCVFYAALFHRSPEGIPYVSDASISDSQRRFLQHVAWETVRSTRSLTRQR
jgi:hypothetical protein